jgi:peptidoglycan/LPS O-acetylase OafA/YrhL
MTRDPLVRVRSVRFQLLDPLRGLAAFWVFTFHYTFSDQFAARFPSLLTVFRVGQLGVPMFFVISGYCLMAAIRLSMRHDEPIATFLRRRSLRIFPPYWCSLIVVALLPFVIEALSALKTGVFVAPTAEGNINLTYQRFGIFDWLRVATLTQVFAHVEGARNLQAKFTIINSVYWTLAIEFQFYLVMTMALWLRTRAVLLLGAVTVVSLPLWYADLWKVSGIFLPYWPMFAVGIGLYLAMEHDLTCRRIVGSSHRAVAVVGLALAMGVFVAVTLRGTVTGDVAFTCGFGFVLWCLHDFDSSYQSALERGALPIRVPLTLFKFLGVMSYSVYLLHGRLQFLAHQLARQLLAAGIALDLTVLALTCAMCAVFYWYCEKPFVRSRTNRPAPDVQAVA